MESKSTSKKRVRNKVENNKIKITRTYKNENELTHPFFHSFFSSSLCTIFFFLNFCFLYSHFFSFLLIVFYFFSFLHYFLSFVFFYFFFFLTSHKKIKWRKQRNFHKTKYKSPTLVWNPFPKQFQGPYLQKVYDNMVFHFLACNELQNERRS